MPGTHRLQLQVKEPAARGRGPGRREEISKVGGKRWREDVGRGRLSRSLSYTKVGNVADMSEAGELKSKRLRADGDEAMVTWATLRPLCEISGGAPISRAIFSI